MTIVLEKAFILRLYSLARQAERSIDFALNSQAMWDEMLEFFGDERLSRFELAARELIALVPDGYRPILRDEIPDLQAYLLPVYLCRFAVNRFRTRWRFRVREVAFFARVFASLIAALQSSTKLETRELVNLRLDLAAMQRIIDGRLMGLSVLRKAQRIEHFCQAAHVASVKWEEIVPDQLTVSDEHKSMPSGLGKTA